MTERFAIYFAPPQSSPLWRRAGAWLGRDCASSALPDRSGLPLAPESLDPLTGSARRYGFHATIKAPMQLAPGRTLEELKAGLSSFVAGRSAVIIPQLDLAVIEGFLALVPRSRVPALEALAMAVVEEFDAFRAPMDAEERARRLKAPLSPHQIRMLERYGYPHVGEDFFFHMTLTDRLPESKAAAVREAAASWFAPGLEGALEIESLSLFWEPEPGAPFRRIADFPFGRSGRS